MTQTTYVVAEVPGAQRSSARAYTHAVIGRRDPAVCAASAIADRLARGAEYRRWDTKHWNDNKRESEATVGQVYRNHNNAMVTALDWQVTMATEWIAKYPTVEAYLKHRSDQHDAHVAELLASPMGEITVLRWSQSLENAQKAVGGFSAHYSGLRVVECVPMAKPESKARRKP